MEGLDAEFLDPERIRLIQILTKNVYTGFRSTLVHPAAHACLWLSDIEILRDFAAQSPAVSAANVVSYGELASDMLKQWLQKPRCSRPPSAAGSRRTSASQTPPVQTSPTSSLPQQTTADAPRAPQRLRLDIPAQSPGVGQPQHKTSKLAEGDKLKNRSRGAADLTKQRDLRCVIQGIPLFDVAHVYPYSMGIAGFCEPFFTTLRLFWTEQKVKDWFAAAYGPTGTETPSNMLCLSPTAHRMHSKACFAFDIDSAADDQTSMNMKFYWLKSATPQPKIALDSRPSLRLRRPENYGLCVYGSGENTGRNIESGDIVKLTTDDPVKKPLPHSKLIELQWLLNRVAALSGAAEADDSWCPDDEDDDNDWPIGVSGYNFIG